MNTSKRKGTGWETAVTEYLRRCGVRYAERRSLNGSKDRGDIAGIPGVVIECKAEKTITLGTYVNEAEAERLNDGADIGAVWIKRRGRTDPGAAYVVITGEQFTRLLGTAGYIAWRDPDGIGAGVE